MNESYPLSRSPELPSSCPTQPVAQWVEPAAALPLCGAAAEARSPAEEVWVGEFLSQRHRPSGLAQATSTPGSWLWDGYLGAGKITLLTSQWKCGKTTLLSILLARMGQGGQLAGLTVAPGRAAVLSEESRDDWDKRCRKLHIGEHASFFCRPFQTKPTLAQWHSVIAAMLELKRQEGLDLLVIDPLAVFMPGNNENTAEAMLECLLPLRALTSRGLAVLILHHPTKGVNQPGQAARGSGALASYADILIEKSWFGRPDEADRRRWLRAYSRHEETRRRLILELVAAGDDYLACDPPPDPALGESWEVLKRVLEDACERLTQQQVLEWWPQDFRKPDLGTISRALARSLEQGLICRNGTGRRNDPYRYWLPGLEAQLDPGPGASPEERKRWDQHWQAKGLQLLLGLAPGSPAENPAAANAREESQSEVVVAAPGVAATASEPCVSEPSSLFVERSQVVERSPEPLVVERSPEPLVVERSPDRPTSEPSHSQETAPQLGEAGVSDPSDAIPREGETAERSAELPAGGPAAPVVPESEPVRPKPTLEPVWGSMAAPPFVLSPIAVPTKEEKERAAELERERRRWRRWP